MKVIRASDLPVKTGAMAPVQVFLTPADGLANVSITLAELKAHSATPDHTHDTDQILYIVEGEALIAGPGGQHRLPAGDLIYIPAGEVHRHEAVGEGAMKHLSIFVPASIGTASSN